MLTYKKEEKEMNAKILLAFAAGVGAGVGAMVLDQKYNIRGQVSGKIRGIIDDIKEEKPNDGFEEIPVEEKK